MTVRIVVLGTDGFKRFLFVKRRVASRLAAFGHRTFVKLLKSSSICCKAAMVQGVVPTCTGCGRGYSHPDPKPVQQGKRHWTY
jgi:hypothetical protein